MLLAGTGVSAEEPPAASAATKPEHSLSPKIVEAVSNKLPKYSPPAPEASGARTRADGILVLPDIKVTTTKQPRVTNYDLLTAKGRLALARIGF